MASTRSPRRELLDIWSLKDRGQGPVLLPPDLSPEGGPPPHLQKAYRRLWLDHLGNSLYLNSILKKGWDHTPRPWRRLLALAFSELQWSPEKDLHGVVHDWVEQARSALGEACVKVINGSLRTATRQLEEGLAPRHGLPDRLAGLLGGQKGRQLLDAPQPLFGFCFSEERTPEETPTVFHHPGLGIVHKLQPGTSPRGWFGHENGFIQNLSAAEVSLEIKNSFLGTSFLDYCAAPGGKSWQLLRLGLPSLTYHDHSPKRLKRLATSSMASKLGSRIAPLDPGTDQLFQGVLIDLPCSNSGVLIKCPEAIAHYWPPSTCFSNLQEEVFSSALNFLAPRGQLYYSTCSIDPVENENRVAHLADRYGLEIISTKTWLPDEQGRHGAFLSELRNCE